MGTITVFAKEINWNTLEDQFDNLLPLLYPARRDAIERLSNQKAKLSSMATGILLQDIIYKELGMKPDNLAICKGEYGKPYVEGHPEFHFNISHSGDMVAVAYGDSSVGIDIEHIRCRENDLKVAKRYFTPEEYTFITSEEFCVDLEGISHSVEERFFMVWTMKEAYLKYEGTGISVPMSSFLVRPYDGVIVGENLKCAPFVQNDYVYTVCVDEGVETSFKFV